MRGRGEQARLPVDHQGQMFYCFDMDSRIPQGHPLRSIKAQADAELARLRPAFAAAYATTGRPSIPPEQLIKATLLQALYTIRSERRLCEEINYNLLYRWFLDLSPEAEVWEHSVFSKNRERFAEHVASELARRLMRRFFDSSVAQAIRDDAASEEHFSVDGTLIEAWASMKSVGPKDSDDDKRGSGDSNRWTNWRGEKRTNETHESKSDPQARLARKGNGQGAILAHSAHALMENRNGLIMDIVIDEANGQAERENALEMLKRMRRRHRLLPETLGADKGYDDGEFLEALECDQLVTPHVAIRDGVIRDDRVAGQCRREARKRQRTKAYQISQRKRKRVEEIFAWLKTIGGLAKTRFVGRWKTQLYAYAASAAYNFLRRARLAAA